MKVSVFKIIKNESFNGYYQTKNCDFKQNKFCFIENNNKKFFYLFNEGKLVLLKDCYLNLENKQCQLFFDFIELDSETFVKFFHQNKYKTLEHFHFQNFLKTLKSNLFHYLNKEEINLINFDLYNVNFINAF